MTWFLDGNNILGRAPEGAEDRSRERLLARFQGCRLPSPCVLVFDGPPPGSARLGSRGRLAVVYSGSRTADEVILSRVKSGDHVVTDDRALALACRGRRARIQSSGEFLASLKPRGGAEPEKPGATAVDVEEWLKVFGGDLQD